MTTTWYCIDCQNEVVKTKTSEKIDDAIGGILCHICVLKFLEDKTNK